MYFSFHKPCFKFLYRKSAHPTKQKTAFSYATSFRMFEHPPGVHEAKVSALARFFHFMKSHKMKGHVEDK